MPDSHQRWICWRRGRLVRGGGGGGGSSAQGLIYYQQGSGAGGGSGLGPGGVAFASGGHVGNGRVTITPLSSCTTTIKTQATASANTGSGISDAATLSGGNTPTGAVNFALFGPDNATCSGSPVFTSIKLVTDNGIYRSDAFATTLPGTYRWMATYSGDANNPPETTTAPCHDAGEVSTVTNATTLTTFATTSALNGGGTISDTATLAGAMRQSAQSLLICSALTTLPALGRLSSSPPSRSMGTAPTQQIPFPPCFPASIVGSPSTTATAATKVP